MEKGEGEEPPFTLHVKFSGKTLSLTVSPSESVSHIKSLLQTLTNVLPRGQKLIFKGKILVDSLSLKSLGLSEGSKIMLMASHGLHQGDGPMNASIPHSSNLMDISLNQAGNVKIEAPAGKSRLERWRLTGIVALSECNLKVVPEEIWACGAAIRVLDLSHNALQELPIAIGSLSSLRKLLLNANALLDKKICWEGVTALKSLTILSLNHNQLTTLPSAIGALSSLKQLQIEHNMLTSLPKEIGQLTSLEILKVDNNRLTLMPSSIGDCCSLIEVDLSANLLTSLAETFENLQNLKILRLSNNGLKTLPLALLKNCSHLCTLDLHGTEITMDHLRELEGWEDFDTRRRYKHHKQLEFSVMSSTEFDEGADSNRGDNW
ncbi:LRR repeats and ubiquitin-like domain-containing protein At2g30105 isoform X1 [Amborella trichopoda]|nr:LRR repeats and ubiquitin-like domain-containing protein At2g30105 isoform X1 [Amborella trichopoda]|eukprot:XP_011624461.1 LRR repeats and ubiquitin-like domain-containing protein At2g30105 isoform X1 [Amborella trichopoda]